MRLGFGLKRSGNEDWFKQRATAFAIVPTYVVFLCFLFRSQYKCLSWMSSIFFDLSFVVIVLTSLYHSILGMPVVIGDYVRNTKLSLFITIFFRILTVIASALLVVAVLYSYI